MPGGRSPRRQPLDAAGGGGGGGRWTAEVTLPPGRYQYKYVADGTWVVDREQPTVMDGYNENNTLEVD